MSELNFWGVYISQLLSFQISSNIDIKQFWSSSNPWPDFLSWEVRKYRHQARPNMGFRHVLSINIHHVLI